MSVPIFRNIELEEFYTETSPNQEDIKRFLSTAGIAIILLKSVMHVISKHMFLKKGQTPVQEFYKLCKKIEFLEIPRKVKYNRKTPFEIIEVL